MPILMKKVSALLLMLLLAGRSYGQPVPNPTDTSYVSASLKKAKALENNNPQAALTYYRRAYEVSKKSHFTKGYFRSVVQYAYALNNVGRHQDARQLGIEAVEWAKTDTSNRNKSYGYFIQANTALFEGKTKEAIPFYQKTADYLLRSDEPENVSTVYQNLGLIYQRQDLYPQALDYYQRALKIDLKYKDFPRQIASDYFSMAVVYGKQKKNDLSRAYYRKARQWIDPRKDLDFVVNLNNNIGYLFMTETRYDSALYYQRESLRLSRDLKNPRHELHALMTLAQTNSQMGNYHQARKLLDQSNAMAEKTKAGLTEFDNLYREYIVANTGLEDYKAALGWMDKYMGIQDSLKNQETTQLLQEYELKLKQAEAGKELAQKQRRIDQLQADRQRQNLWILIAALTALAIIGGLTFAWLYARQRRRTADNALLAAQRESQLAVVQSELQGQQKERRRIAKEMHDDLGASLTAIGLLSEVVKTRMGPNTTPEVEKISSISAEMVTAMNEIIWSLNTKNDSLNGLIAYTRSYAREFIDNTTLTLRTDVEESPREIIMRGADRRNVFLTVKEALNNVVKHAQASQVTLRIQPEADQLTIEVGDNGGGFTPTGGVSLRNGLGNMQSRMTDAGGKCEILSSETGTCVKIIYPYPPVRTDKIPQMQYSV